jgi:hypothetical protein
MQMSDLCIGQARSPVSPSKHRQVGMGGGESVIAQWEAIDSWSRQAKAISQQAAKDQDRIAINDAADAFLASRANRGLASPTLTNTKLSQGSCAPTLKICGRPKARASPQTKSAGQTKMSSSLDGTACLRDGSSRLECDSFR